MSALQFLGSGQVNPEEQRHQGQWYEVQLSLWNDTMNPTVLSQNTALTRVALK